MPSWRVHSFLPSGIVLGQKHVGIARVGVAVEVAAKVTPGDIGVAAAIDRYAMAGLILTRTQLAGPLDNWSFSVYGLPDGDQACEDKSHNYQNHQNRMPFGFTQVTDTGLGHPFHGLSPYRVERVCCLRRL